MWKFTTAAGAEKFTAASAVSYGTALPTTAVDGQEFTLVDSLTNPTYTMRFRYNASSVSAFKWEFIGGAPMYARVAAQEGTASTSDVDLTTVGPSITLPRAGDYLFRWGACAQETGSGGGNAVVTVYINAGAYASSFSDVTIIAGAVMTAYSTAPAPGRSAGDVIKLKYQITNGITANFFNRFLEVVPIRVA